MRLRLLIAAAVSCSVLVGGVTAVAANTIVTGPNTGTVACPKILETSTSSEWPLPSWESCSPATITQSSPTLADWDGETIAAIGDERGYVQVYDAATGAELPGWPRRMAGAASASIAIESSPTIAFLDGPTSPPSIIVGSGSTWVPDSVGEVEAFRLSGAPRFVFHVGAARGTAVGVISSPAVGDILGNGGVQIAFGSWDHHIYVLNGSGQMLGFAYDNADTIWSSPALYTPPGSPGADLVIGSDASGRLIDGKACWGGYISAYVWSATAENPDTDIVGAGLKRLWYHCTNQSVWSSPAIGIINSTGEPAVVVGTSFYEQPFPSDTDTLQAFYLGTGRPVPGWPVTTAGPVLGSPAIGVINSSGEPAVVDTAWACSGLTRESCISSDRSELEAWSGSGQPLWSTPLLGPTDFSSPVLVPLLGNSWNDVLVGTSEGMYSLAGATGRYAFGTDYAHQWSAIDPGCRMFNSPAVGDIEGTGPGAGWHVLVGCGGPPAFKLPGEVASYPLPDQPASAGWPMFRGGSDHEGSASPFIAEASSATPSWAYAGAR
jgi:hypothetical protein